VEDSDKNIIEEGTKPQIENLNNTSNGEENKSTSSGLNTILKLLAFVIISILGYLIITTSIRDYGKHEIVDNSGTSINESEFESEDEVSTTTDIEVKEDTTSSIATPINNSNTNTSEELPNDPSAQKTPTPVTEVTPKVTEKKITTNEIITSPPSSVSTPKEETPKPAAVSGGSILVIAGNYIQESNAKELEKKLKKAGIQNTEIIVFDFSEFHTVIVGRYTDMTAAKKMVSTLKSKGFDSYTHQKRSKNK
jgi:cell division septation protein DedD